MHEMLLLLLIVVGWIVISVVALKLYVPIKNWVMVKVYKHLWKKAQKDVTDSVDRN